MNTVHTLFLLGFVFTIAQIGSLTGKFTPVKILDWAFVQWRNVAICKYHATIGSVREAQGDGMSPFPG